MNKFKTLNLIVAILLNFLAFGADQGQQESTQLNLNLPFNVETKFVTPQKYAVFLHITESSYSTWSVAGIQETPASAAGSGHNGWWLSVSVDEERAWAEHLSQNPGITYLLGSCGVNKIFEKDFEIPARQFIRLPLMDSSAIYFEPQTRAVSVYNARTDELVKKFHLIVRAKRPTRKKSKSFH